MTVRTIVTQRNFELLKYALDAMMKLHVQLGAERKRQFDTYYAQLLRLDMLVGSDIKRFYPEIEVLIQREVNFVTKPTMAESELLAKRWGEMHQRLVAHLQDSALDLAWHGLEQQLSMIVRDERRKRGRWLSSRMSLSGCLPSWLQWLRDDKYEETRDSFEDVLLLMEATADSITQSSLPRSLSPE